jgi:hypothetical protein
MPSPSRGLCPAEAMQCKCSNSSTAERFSTCYVSRVIRLTDAKVMYLKPKYYLAIAGAVAFAIGAVMEIPLPSHPDSRVTQQRVYRP